MYLVGYRTYTDVLQFLLQGVYGFCFFTHRCSQLLDLAHEVSYNFLMRRETNVFTPDDIKEETITEVNNSLPLRKTTEVHFVLAKYVTLYYYQFVY